MLNSMKKKNLKKLLLTNVLVNLVIILSAQSNYLQGYVVTLGNDTLVGYIDYRNWDINPDVISFRETIQSNETRFRASQITSFHVNNETYKAARVLIEISPRQTNNLHDFQELRTMPDTVFLKAVILGPKSLYFCKNKSGIENFYIYHEGEFRLLEYKRYIKKPEQVITENKKYVGQLMVYLENYPEMRSKLQNVKYSYESLEKIFEAFYQYTGEEISVSEKKEKAEFNFGALSGLTITKLKFQSERDEFDFLTNPEYQSSENFSAGLSLELVIPRNFRRWSIYNELLFQMYKVKGLFKIMENETGYSYVHTQFGYKFLLLNNMIRYSYPGGKRSFFINAGLLNGFAFGEINKRIDEISAFGEINTYEYKALADTKKYYLGYCMGAGFKYRNYTLEARYEKGQGMSEYVYLKSSIQKYVFLLGYRF
jgi:hypothetical protein